MAGEDKRTAARKAIDAAAGSPGFTLRRMADTAMVLSGLFLILRHSMHGHSMSIDGWLLLAIGGTDLGIQGLAAAVRAVLRR